MRLDHLLLSKDSIVLSGVFTSNLHSEFHVGLADVDSPVYGALAQLGEHLLCKQGVVGSIPTGSTTRCAFISAVGNELNGHWVCSSGG